MEDNLVGYLLGALDDDAHKQVEAHLRTDPQAQQQLELLKRALAPLNETKEEIEPATGLVYRTLARVAEHRCRPLTPAPVPPVRLAPPDRSWWRPANFLVAAVLLLGFVSLLVPGVTFLRAREARVECQNNLGNFHRALTYYSDTNNSEFPKVPEEPPYNVAGIFVILLRENGSLGPDPDSLEKPVVSLRCPGNGGKRLPSYTFQDLGTMPQDELERVLSKLAGCYAYTLGYRDPTGELCGLRRDPSLLNNDLLPIMADKPQVSDDTATRSNSPNHGGGQNVLFIGGHVRYCTNCNVGIDGDNIYLNRDGKVAAGKDQFDTVLGCCADQPGKVQRPDE